MRDQIFLTKLFCHFTQKLVNPRFFDIRPFLIGIGDNTFKIFLGETEVGDLKFESYKNFGLLHISDDFNVCLWHFLAS